MSETVVEDASTPSAARRRVGAALKTAREAAGLSLDEAAHVIQRTAPTLSRLERGRLSKPRLVDVKALLERYGNAVDPARRDGILRLAGQAAAPEWFKKFSDVLGGSMTVDDAQRYIEFENDASVIRSYEPEMIPGLLQVRGYAEAVTDAFFPEHSPAERERFVELRLARQQVLERPNDPLVFDAVIGELALRRQVADEAIMRDQIQALLDLSTASNVTVRIAPIELGHPAAIGGSFVVMDLADPDENGVVYLESRGAPQFVQDDDTHDKLRPLHRDLVDAVLSVEKSRNLLEVLAKTG